MPTTATPPSPAAPHAVQTSISTNARQVGEDGETWRTPDGAIFRLNDNTLSLKRLNPGLCKIMFDAARLTNSYLAMNGSEATPLVMRGSKGETPGDLPKAITIENAPTLCVRLHIGLRAWNHFVRSAQASGLLGPDEQPLEPPADPGAEPRLADDSSSVVAHCEMAFRDMNKRLAWTTLRVVISRNPQWGVVWRADVAPSDDPDSTFRNICWRRRGHPGIALETRPLMMFDPAQSIGPLKASD